MNDVVLVRGRWVITGGAETDPVLSNSAVVVADDSIRDFGDWPSVRAQYPEARVLGSEHAAVMPGLINAHHHSSGVTSLQQGIPDLLLERWILMHRRARPTDSYLDTLLSAARLLRTGVTTVVDVHSGGGTVERYGERVRRALKAYDEAGIRVALAAGIKTESHLVAGKGQDERFLASLPGDLGAEVESWLPDPGDISVDEYLALMEELWRAYRDHPRIDIWFAPPGPQWVSDEFMQRIVEKAAALDTGIQTHVEESIYEKLHGPLFYGKPTVEHLRDLGVLSPRFSIAHGVWLSEPEIAILAETGAAISHNPSSNLRLCAGIAPLNALLASGVTVALGMDGTTLGDDEDMFSELRLALRLQRTPALSTAAPTPAHILDLATAGGAKLLRKETTLGKLALGYAADIVVVDLARLTWPWVAPEADPRELVLLRAKAGDVDTVLVGGEVVWQGGKPTRFDVEAAGRELAAMLDAAPYPAAAAERVERLLPYVERYYEAWDLPEFEPYIRYNSKR